MGDVDLTCETDEKLAESVSHNRRAVDDYGKLRHLQIAFMDGHDELAPGVFRTRYSDGSRVYVNYGDAAAAVDGVTVPARDWLLK